ncbi:Protein CBG16471 [Caenorhabditis briggsae]|uniref:Protein CBG16471 n=1 Tax=Caenorhabditis briggsae TaxID=6238 RepID=A8XP48_CAEBR|nr:Protein CBG16471 [Caenorhabditis briggsae]CAP34424.2 Protein CBG16471 [Caenorhabditis briggsae]
MAWADTEFIGCGAKKCESPFLPGMDVLFEFRMACLYKEKGNILNSNIYQQGKACSSCPSGFKCEGDSGLCVRN